ncbi:unnamed protein product [Pleuronectes platessa]|uniref:Uncharacterized protein n=1 Tax=Pleuronectes platessa TaxID=8262 RepID=A0A9N7TVV3_PLEPL|nr:unnamed protein product [Pleuronectes platessa]
MKDKLVLVLCEELQAPKRTRKSAASKTPAQKLSNSSSQPRASASTDVPGNLLTATLQSLASTLQKIDTRLENIENATNVALYSANTSKSP